MCLICGFINYENSIEKSLEILNKLKFRGKDGAGIYFENNLYLEKDLSNFNGSLPLINGRLNSPKIIFSHLLHSIVNYVLQPIKKNSNILISNCEIYNWHELKKEYNLNSKNDSELILDLIELKGYKNIKEIINLFSGPFAFSYFNKKDNKLILCRDIIGEKPIYYSHFENKFAFCSEKKALVNLNNINELNPREILIYDINTNKIKKIKNELEYSGKILKNSYDDLKKETLNLLEKSILKQIPKNQKIGLLFSGGIDSTFIAYILKKHKIDFTCYTAKLEGGNIKEATDYIYAKEIAKKYDFKLKVAKINVKDLETEVKQVINIIEESEYIKVSVALPFLISSKLAKKDQIKLMFSGLGSEELFAGYRRHKKVKDVNYECYLGLLSLHNRDLYRDDVICMSQSQEIRLPFLDLDLINYALKIPVRYKLNLDENRSKIILRDIAFELGLDKKYSERAKKAAQYGSKFDKGLLRLAKNANVGKQEYLDNLSNSNI